MPDNTQPNPFTPSTPPPNLGAPGLTPPPIKDPNARPFSTPSASTQPTPTSSGFKVTNSAASTGTPLSPQPAWKPNPTPMPASTTVPTMGTPSPIGVQPKPVMPGSPATPANPAFGSTPVKPLSTNPALKPTPPMSTASSTAGTPPPTGTQPRKSIFRFLPFLLLGAIVIGILGYAAYWYKNKQASTTTGTTTTQEKKTIVYWGLWEPTAVMDQILKDFETQNPGYTVKYVQQSPKEYRERLQAEIAKGTGPDVFRFHASWVPMLREELSPLPEKVMSTQEFDQTFYPVAVKQLTLNNTIVGMPLMIDGLGLYYNKDIFNIANKTPPKNWDEMKLTASALTIKAGGKITRGGIAMGTASNVEHFSEILALLMLQNGADPSDPTTPKAQEALNFYMDFASKLGVWDTTLPNATVAFAKGDVAMMIAPSWRVHEIKASNPNLQFDIVPVPQLPDTERTTWASFWAEGVSSKSVQKEGSWLLLKYLSSAEVEKKMYSEASKTRAFGELYSRKDLADQIASSPYVGAYIQDAPFAKAWYLNGYTHDNGINDHIIKYYEDAINAGQGAIAGSANTVKQGMIQVLTQYGMTTQVPATGK